MPGLTPDDIRGRLERFGEAVGRTQRFAIEPCGDRVFHIHGHRQGARAGDDDSPWLKRLVRRLGGAAAAR
jgi:hypothetical protein